MLRTSRKQFSTYYLPTKFHCHGLNVLEVEGGGGGGGVCGGGGRGGKGGGEESAQERKTSPG